MQNANHDDTIMMALDLQAAKFFKLDLAEMNGNEFLAPTSPSNQLNDCSRNQADRMISNKSSEKVGRASNPDSNIMRRQASIKKQCDHSASSTLKQTPMIATNNLKSTTSSKNLQVDSSKRSQKSKNLSLGHRENLNNNRKNTISHYDEDEILSWSNSLPSISSSPSLSPSLVCPHLSLDDLLSEENRLIINNKRSMNLHSKSASECGNLASQNCRSPHTIGLCPKCRTNPPPNLHSPLSPVFAASQQQTSMLKRGYSDQHDLEHRRSLISSDSNQTRHSERRLTTRGDSNQVLMAQNHANNINDNNKMMSPKRLRDDSLDCFLDPEVARMSQLSPVMRHSVGFIRTHSSESSRVIKVYKNGQPYDWPLRLCIGRSEFKSLNHLLDHINNRLSISSGARYLFHLDGQIVYSVNELKHNHCYLVSGTRHLDLHSSQIIRERNSNNNSRNGSSQNIADSNQEANQLKLPQLIESGAIKNSKHAKHSHRHGKIKAKQLINDQIGLDQNYESNSQVVPTASRDSPNEVNHHDHHEQQQQHQKQFAIHMNHERVASSRRQNGNDKDIPTMRGPIKGKSSSVTGDEMNNHKKNLNIKTREIGVNATSDTRTFTRKVAQLDNMNSEVTRTVSEAIVTKPSLKLNLESSNREAITVKPKPPNLIRAKSDTNGLTTLQRGHRKKNVTFLDTGRGSSPALTNIGLSNPDLVIGDYREYHADTDSTSTSSMKNRFNDQTMSSMEMRDIGIQVNDNIEGFLIDLPIALPSDRLMDDPSESLSPKHTYLRRGQGQTFNRRRVSAQDKQKNVQAKSKQPMATKGRVPCASGKIQQRRRQIVTITEKQLSNDEMSILKDLDQGDHHHESPPVTQSPPSMHSLNLSMEANVSAGDSMDEKDPLEDVSLYIDETIVPCPPFVNNLEQIPAADNKVNDLVKITQQSETKIDQNTHAKNGATISAIKKTSEIKSVIKIDTNNKDEPWQQPRGSATPTERPISQNAANETVHARISTPTPSISTTGGDTTSLSISYETTYHWIQRQQQAQQLEEGKPMQFPMVELPDKERFPVLGDLCSGSSEPASNFKLIWINGFGMNNHPNIHADHHHHQQSINRTGSLAHATDNLLNSNADKNKETIKHHDSFAFVPSVRFHNWVHHSLNHDEIIYPVGKIIILWCRWTDEQRYYSEHASNVCALSLGPDETDLAVSAQISEPKENIHSTIHVWSITKLQLLHKIDARDPSSAGSDLDLYRIFSLRLNVIQSQALPGCLELVAGLSNQKRLWINYYELRPLAGEVGDYNAKSGFKTLETKAYKAIQQYQQHGQHIYQIPLVVSSSWLHTIISPGKNGSRKSIDSNTNVENNAASERRLSRVGNAAHTLLFGLGRRLFQVWHLEQAKLGTNLRNLRPLLCEDRPPPFVSAISKANCWLHWSPNQILVGDSSGNVTLIEISLILTDHHQPETKSSITKSATSVGNAKYKYRIDHTHAILSLGGASDELQVTCLTRVSNSIFILADSSGSIQAYKLSEINEHQAKVEYEAKLFGKALKIPEDFGCACCIVLARYSKSLSQIDFYIASSTNSIMFASIQAEKDNNNNNHNHNSHEALKTPTSLSIVYDGHETSVISLVPESSYGAKKQKSLAGKIIAQASQTTNDLDSMPYFTCSLDCKICKWQGKSLVWKSVLPSACASMALHPTGFVLAVGSGDGTIYILDKVSGLLISYFPLTPVCINCLAYSRDGSLLAAGCANGSIFILPVLERGLKYNKVSIFQSPYPVLSVQFSLDSKYILTSVTHGSYQELILWDLPNFRYMRNEVTMAADKIRWFDSICSGSEDVRAIWENANMASACQDLVQSKPAKLNIRRQSVAGSLYTNPTQSIVNLSCHRLIRKEDTEVDVEKNDENQVQNLVIASDIRGFVRLFQYPCYDIQQGFYQIRISSSPVNCCRFLSIVQSQQEKNDNGLFVTTSVDGSICLWALVPSQREI